MPHRARELLVVLPCFNERETLADVIARVHTQLPDAHVLVVDDASPDGTGALADDLAATDARVFVLHRSGKLGLGSAYLAGFAHAADHGYRWVAEMDADGSHLPEQLPKLVEAARAGAGLVIGARWIPGGTIENWPWYRELVSRLGTRVARTALRSRLHDLTSGYRVLDAEWLPLLQRGEIASQGYGFQVESAWLLERAACPIAEVPITFVERTGGRSKMTVGIAVEALWSVLVWGWRIRRGARSHDKSAGPE